MSPFKSSASIFQKFIKNSRDWWLSDPDDSVDFSPVHGKIKNKMRFLLCCQLFRTFLIQQFLFSDPFYDSVLRFEKRPADEVFFYLENMKRNLLFLILTGAYSFFACACRKISVPGSFPVLFAAEYRKKKS